MPKIRPNEHDHPGDPDRQPNLAAPRDVMVAQQQAIEHQKPERRNRNQQRRETGGNDQLRIREREIAAHQKQNADGREMPKLARRKTNATSSQRAVSEHHRARDQEARGAHDARRNLLNRASDAQISRSTEDIDQPEGKNDLPSTRGRSNTHGSRSGKSSEYQSQRRKSGDRVSG